MSESKTRPSTVSRIAEVNKNDGEEVRNVARRSLWGILERHCHGMCYIRSDSGNFQKQSKGIFFRSGRTESISMERKREKNRMSQYF